MKNIAIIPARGGSKRIPRKNIKPFMGKPIIAYSIEAALHSGLFDEVMVSTDDEEIAAIARQYGASVPFYRSAEMSNDYATTADVIEEVLDIYKENGQIFDNVCCLYATAPFVTSHRLKDAFEMMINKEYNSVYPIVLFSYPVQRGLNLEDGKIGMVWPEHLNTRSQDLPPIYHDAGQFYVSTAQSFYSVRSFLTNNTGGLILSELEVQDLDTEIDWKLAEMKYQLLRADNEENLF
ncbi:MAG TPA: pseudaminic acid cytidylyltransferase [Candidatus Gallibacteroides avistercoris]|uniref:Pseudaminic acid cytidylyltransferase n=1 Tax=Candidatus Gallibacteroides avistercoris TaxID=2840833 RepID=A0A9D1M8X4_9BACT|nr:pseudaminic acid cytidylyltransferase [Candidatus Gallibacteroides avistercoris]